MPTNDRKVNIYYKRLLGRTALKEQFLDYLQGCIDEVSSGFFAGSSGTLDDTVVGLGAGGVAGTFSINTTNAQRVLAGQHVIDLTKITGTGITTDIPFENQAGVTYWVGVFFAEVETGLEVNARTGDPEYQALKQTFGNVDNPKLESDPANSVVDHGTYIRLYLDSITETNASHAGRKVKVWLVDPCSPNESIAFFEGTVAYSAPDNYVDIPYSGAAGPLGQDTSILPPSTVRTAYKVFIEGVSWRRNTNLSLVSTCAFLGTVTGGVPVTASTTGQQLLQIVSLDRAYDGVPGPGIGRNIYVDAGAVELWSSGDTGDHHRAQFRLNRIGSTGYFRLVMEVLEGGTGTIPFVALQAVSHAGALTEQESVSVAGDTVTFTGGAANLLDTAMHLGNGHCLLWLRSGVPAGLYAIHSITGATTLTARKLVDGTSPAWAAGNSIATILTTRAVLSNGNPINQAAVPGALDQWRGLMLSGKEGTGSSTPMLILHPAGGAGKMLAILNNRLDSVSHMADPLELLQLDIDASAGDPINPGGTLKLGQDVGARGPDADVHTKLGVEIRPRVIGSMSADAYGINIKPQLHRGKTGGHGSHRIVGLFNDDEIEINRWEPVGRMADTHRFVERFDYSPLGLFPATQRWYKRNIGANGGGTIYFNDPSLDGLGMKGNGDICHMRTAGVADGDGYSLEGPPMWLIRDNGGQMRVLNLYMRARLIDTDTRIRAEMGIIGLDMTDSLITLGIANPGDDPADWSIKSIAAGNMEQHICNPGFPPDITGTLTNDLGWTDFYLKICPELNLNYFWVSTISMTQWGSQPIRAGGLQAGDWLNQRVLPFVILRQNSTTSVRDFEIDHFEAWDELIQAGPAE